MLSQQRTVAFFDFDGTLATRDSLWPFLLAARGAALCYAALVVALLRAVVPPKGIDRRTSIKDTLLFLLLRGVRPEKLKAAIERMRSWPVWIEKSVETLRHHHDKGACVVIASGSLDLYLPAMLKDVVPYEDLICTEMEIVNGVLTGRMKKGNCVRARKAERVAAYIAANGPFADSWAYGNLPHDLPMMELAKHRVAVKGKDLNKL